MGQDILDLIIVVTLVLFTIRGLSNGFISEIAGICSLLGGFWAARAWGNQIAPWLDFISDPSLRFIAAYTLVFVVAMLIIGVLARILKKIAAFSFVNWIDKLAGGILGLAKGILIWTLIFLVLEKLFTDAPFIRESRALPYFTAIIELIKQWLPPEFASKL